MNVTFSKFSSAVITAGKRILKLKQFGVKTAKECAPFGFDSQPLEGMTAIYMETSNKEEAVVVGYVNKQQLAEGGESRMYAVGEDGAVVSYVWSKKDGTIGLNGFDHSSIRFGPLQTALQDQNVLIQAELQKIALAISLLGGSYSPGSTSIVLGPAESQTVKIK